MRKDTQANTDCTQCLLSKILAIKSQNAILNGSNKKFAEMFKHHMFIFMDFRKNNRKIKSLLDSYMCVVVDHLWGQLPVYL